MNNTQMIKDLKQEISDLELHLSKLTDTDKANGIGHHLYMQLQEARFALVNLKGI